MKSCWNCVTNKKIFEKNRCYHRNSVSWCLKQVCPNLPWISIRFGMDWNWMHDSNFSIFLLFFFNFPSRSFCFLPKKKMSSDDYWVENMLRKLKGFLKFSSISKVGGYPGLFPILILNLTSYGLINIQRRRKDSKSGWATCKN